MNKLIATIAAASMLFATQAPAFATDHGKAVKPVVNVSTKHRFDNRAKFTAGLALGAIIVGAVIASRVQAEKPSYEGKCGMWRNDCRFGSDRACYKYDTRC